MHHQHRNDTSEKNEQHNSQADKNSRAHRVILLVMLPEWRRAGKLRQRRTICCELSLNLLWLRQWL